MGILKSIFGGKESSTDSTMSFQQAADIAGVYGDVLKNYSPGTVADASKLPFSKSTIKLALLTLLKSNTDPQMLEHLKSSYWMLADWQEGVGDKNVGLDPITIDTSDPLKVAKYYELHGDAIKKWSAKAEVERQQLRGNLRDLGYI